MHEGRTFDCCCVWNSSQSALWNYFSSSSHVIPTLLTRAQTVPPISWNMSESSRPDLYNYFNSWIKPWNSHCFCLILGMGCFFLFWFSKIRISWSLLDVISIFFTECFFTSVEFLTQQLHIVIMPDEWDSLNSILHTCQEKLAQPLQDRTQGLQGAWGSRGMKTCRK